MEKKNKPKKCKCCNELFTPVRPLQYVCSFGCSIEYTKDIFSKQKKKEDKIQKEKLKTHSDHLKDLQIIFNTYIRERDKGKPCISCDKFLIGNDVNASHFYSVGAYPNLRFNEHNVHSSCIECNKHKHGNINEYVLRLPNRIGLDNYNKLIEDRLKPLKLTLGEIEVLKIKYRELTKMLRNGRS